MWFKPYAAGFYAYKYLGLELSREEASARMDELLMVERRVVLTAQPEPGAHDAGHATEGGAP